jgi:response regulator RpfG family c-di-GMP phosphodiesterase
MPWQGEILVVDDDAINREPLQEFSVTEGLEVVTAPDGRSSLETFARLEPDLVLLDVNMPFVDGFEVCRRLKSNPETRLTPVVLVTALSATDDRVRGTKVGADRFLSKPVDHSELLAHVRSLLSLKDYTYELEPERICAPLKSFRLVLPIIRHHHEKLNGSGYPDGLKSDDIPITARVLLWTCTMPSRPRGLTSVFSRTEALEMMEEEVNKGWWDPSVFQEFRQMPTGAGAVVAGAKSQNVI